MHQNVGSLLVVDDEDIVRIMMSRTLERAGWSVDNTDSAHAGLQLLLTNPDRYRGVTLDISMPDMNGVQMLHTLRQTLPTLPVLLVSGHSPDAEFLEFIGQDPHLNFLEKPFNLTVLSMAIESAFGTP